MKSNSAASWAVRISWPLLAGAWGAWLGAQGYAAVPHNADSVAMPFVMAFFGLFALVGLVGGMVLGALTGGLVEKLLRLLGVNRVGALAMATFVNGLVCWQLAGVIQAKYPGSRPPVARPPVKAAGKPPTGNPCERPPPEEPRDRSLWDEECR